MENEIFWNLYRCSTMTVTAFCTTWINMSFEEEIVLSSVEYSFINLYPTRLVFKY